MNVSTHESERSDDECDSVFPKRGVRWTATNSSGVESCRPSFRTALMRGIRGSCPRCGRARIFKRWFTIHPKCLSCGLDFESLQPDTWAFMYITTAGMTGLIVVVMLLIRPSNLFVGRVVLVCASASLIVGTLPYRKGLAIAIESFIRYTRGDSGYNAGSRRVSAADTLEARGETPSGIDPVIEDEPSNGRSHQGPQRSCPGR